MPGASRKNQTSYVQESNTQTSVSQINCNVLEEYRFAYGLFDNIQQRINYKSNSFAMSVWEHKPNTYSNTLAETNPFSPSQRKTVWEYHDRDVYHIMP